MVNRNAVARVGEVCTVTSSSQLPDFAIAGRAISDVLKCTGSGPIPAPGRDSVAVTRCTGIAFPVAFRTSRVRVTRPVRVGFAVTCTAVFPALELVEYDVGAAPVSVACAVLTRI